eukprot:bmy_01238T0
MLEMIWAYSFSLQLYILMFLPKVLNSHCKRNQQEKKAHTTETSIGGRKFFSTRHPSPVIITVKRMILVCLFMNFILFYF